MVLSFNFNLPFDNPVAIFTLILFIFLLIPLLLNKIKIPSIIGLILAGVLIGPFGFNLIKKDSITLFSTTGLLYIMFLAALELDLNEFKKNKSRSLVFGALTFIIPLTLGTIACRYILDFGWLSSLLIASMFSSHTLVSYPITARLGITKNEAVTIAVGGTIITDTAVLLVLSIITGSTQGSLDITFWIKLIVSLLIFGSIIFLGFPRLGRWFFRNVQGENNYHYVFVLALVFLSGLLAEIAGIEPIIGAFLAGLALNKLIPHSSSLMNRINFVGNAIFIPFFLVSVGMLVDLKVLLSGTEALIVALILIIVALMSKWLAALATQKIFKYSTTQGRLLFGLSSAHAAATLAVILVGYNLNLVNKEVLNGTILLILVTCLVSSFITELSGRKQAIIEGEKKLEGVEEIDRILVPIANPLTIEGLIDLAIMIKNPDYDEPLYPLAVVNDDNEAKEKILLNNRMLQKATQHALASDQDVRIVTRVDVNVANGILRAVKELLITEIVIGWNAKISTKDKVFGSILDALVSRCAQLIFVTKITVPLNTNKKIIVFVPELGEYEHGFGRWIKKVIILAKQIGADLRFYCSRTSQKALQEQIALSKSTVFAEYEIFKSTEDYEMLAEKLQKDHLYIFVSARKNTISHHHNLDKIPNFLSKYFYDSNFIIIYPEQNIVESL